MKQLLIITLFSLSFSSFAEMSMRDFAKEMKGAVDSSLIADIKNECAGQRDAVLNDHGITVQCEEALQAAEDMSISVDLIEKIVNEL